MTCRHYCNFPEGDCTGACLTPTPTRFSQLAAADTLEALDALYVKWIGYSPVENAGPEGPLSAFLLRRILAQYLEDAAEIATGADLIALERHRQIEEEGHSPQADAFVGYGPLRDAAYCYFIAPGPDTKCPPQWPWAPERWKPASNVRNLVKAGALYRAATDAAGDLEDAPIFRVMADSCADIIDRLIRQGANHE